jgi:hypothetical protein
MILSKIELINTWCIKTFCISLMLLGILGILKVLL